MDGATARRRRRWHTYGCLADHFDTETENEALKIAQRTIRAGDQRLLSRLDFEQESSGTAIMGADRRDLEAALAILGLADQPLR